MKHFRHITGGEHWEPETADHLLMKLEISKMTELLGWSTVLEQRIGQGNDHAIADVYIDNGKNRISIECQCSNVTVEDFERRDRFYRQLAITPLWILGGKFFEHAITRKKSERTDRDAYDIQKILSLEKSLMRQERLFYYGRSTLYIGDFKFRWKRKEHVTAEAAEYYSTYDHMEHDESGNMVLYWYDDTLGRLS